MVMMMVRLKDCRYMVHNSLLFYVRSAAFVLVSLFISFHFINSLKLKGHAMALPAPFLDYVITFSLDKLVFTSVDVCVFSFVFVRILIMAHFVFILVHFALEL